MKTRLKRKKKRRRVRASVYILTFLFAAIGIFVYNFYSDIASAVDNMHKPISREVSDKRETKVEVEKKEPVSILLVGVDEREGDSGRTDSMLVMTLNPEENSTKIVSIARDTRTELINKEDPDENFVTKINHAYAYGGIEMSIDTVENFLNVPIDYYIEVNMAGFKDIVDAVGGIEVNNEYEFELDGTHLTEGYHKLNGVEALQYARMRKEDPRGDFGRQERQREVITKVIKKGASLSSVKNFDEILMALEGNIKTNLTFDEMLDFPINYKPAASNMEKIEIPGEGETFDDGVWYFLVDDETRQDLSNQLRTHLGLQQETVASIDLY